MFDENLEIRTQTATIVFEHRSIRRQFVRRVYGTVAGMVGVSFGAIYAFNMSSHFFSAEQRFLPWAAVITALYCSLLSVIAKYSPFDLTRLFGWRVKQSIILLSAMIVTALMIVLVVPMKQKLLVFVTITLSYLSWVYALLTQIVTGGRTVSMPIAYVARCAVMLSVTTVTVFLYVLMVTQIVTRQLLMPIIDDDHHLTNDDDDSGGGEYYTRNVSAIIRNVSAIIRNVSAIIRNVSLH